MNYSLGLIASGLVALITAGVVGCNRSNAAIASGAQGTGMAPVAQVTTVKPMHETVRRLCNQPAYVAAFQETPLFAKISGYVLDPNVDIGDTVQKDQVLAELWVPELVHELKMKESLIVQATTEQAQASAMVQTALAAVETARAKIEEVQAGVKRVDGEYARWKSQLEREEQLAAERTIQAKVVEETRNHVQAADAARDEAAAKVKSAKANLLESEAKLTNAKADVDAACARVTVARDDHQRMNAMLEYAKIRAPFDGIVSARNVDSGHFIPASGTTKPLFTIVRVDSVRIFLDVPEKEAARIKTGQRATVRVDALSGEAFEGPITRFTWALDPNTRTMRTEIDVANPHGKLRPGMYGYATITVEERSNALTLPVAALIKQGDNTMVCCVVAGRVTRKPVTPGINDGTIVEITSGLSGEEDIVSANGAVLTEGQQVTLKI